MLPPYLRRVVVNLASNRRRSLTRRLRALARLDRSGSEVDLYPSDIEALLALSPETRAVLWLADVEGVAFDEIGRQLRLSPSAARKRASRGRAQIRARVEGGAIDGP